MARYTYLACDLRTNAILAELPLKGVMFDGRLNASGSFKGHIPLHDSTLIAKLDPISSTQPNRTALYVDRDGVLVWGGYLRTRNYSSDYSRLEIAGNEFFSYLFDHRRILDTKTYAAQDQLFIVRDLVNYAQAKTGGNIGITVGAETSGVARDRTYWYYEGKPVGEAIAQLSAVDKGFDFSIDVAYNSSLVPTKTLVLSYPRRGRIASLTGHVFEYPGNITGYIYPEDGTLAANTVFAAGSGQGDSMLRSTVSRPDLIDAGYPLMETVSSYKDVSAQATLDDHARADLAALASPVAIPEFYVRADLDPVLGSYITGDDARFRITDERFNKGRNADGTYIGPGLDTYLRVIGYEVIPGDDVSEKVRLIAGVI